MSEPASPPPEWKRRWVDRRNRLFASKSFQKWASIIWPVSLIARSRATRLFDHVAGFTYTQTLLAVVESGLMDRLAMGPATGADIAAHTALPEAAGLRLVRAASALDLAQEVSPGHWMLGEQGAALQANEGAMAMVRHHRILYRDLTDPLALLRANRTGETELSRFWRYGSEEGSPEATAYSKLMGISQAMVAEQVLAAYDFSRHSAVLDVGGGHGRFITEVAKAHAGPRLGVFDLPPVLEGTATRLSQAGVRERVELHPGDFFHSRIPPGYDCVTLVRILHDHDDNAALELLRGIRAALPPGGRLVIAEPMAKTKGAKGMGDAYFGLYLWAMNAGRPRSPRAIMSLLKAAGFRSSRKLATRQPVIASTIVSFL